jgi:hypothetical protein
VNVNNHVLMKTKSKSQPSKRRERENGKRSDGRMENAERTDRCETRNAKRKPRKQNLNPLNHSLPVYCRRKTTNATVNRSCSPLPSNNCGTRTVGLFLQENTDIEPSRLHGTVGLHRRKGGKRENEPTK